jgi:hypothetical protein
MDMGPEKGAQELVLNPGAVAGDGYEALNIIEYSPDVTTVVGDDLVQNLEVRRPSAATQFFLQCGRRLTNVAGRFHFY